MKNLIYMMLTLVSLPTYAFDIGDYKTTFDATRDAYIRALNQYTLSQREMAFLIKMMGGRLTPEGVSEFMIVGGKLDSCGGLKDAQNSRSRAKVVTELTSLLSDPLVQKVQSAQGNQAQVDAILADVDSYYDQFDESFVTEVGIMTEQPVYADDASWFMYQPQFDLEDYASTLRATRDRFLKAKNELDLATGPYDAAKTAYVEAVKNYLNYDNCADFGVDDSLEEVLAAYTL